MVSSLFSFSLSLSLFLDVNSPPGGGGGIHLNSLEHSHSSVLLLLRRSSDGVQPRDQHRQHLTASQKEGKKGGLWEREHLFSINGDGDILVFGQQQEKEERGEEKHNTTQDQTGKV